ncbi:MAG: VWA domain-containing protein [Actinobacteria bacterium]|nr:VWA domain-containing protein [Actinomycetota bacterium]
MRVRSRAPAVDSHDAGALRVASLRTGVFRVLLVAAVVALFALAAASARGSDIGTQQGLLPGSTGVVVIDLSLSIGPEDYNDIRRTLRRLVDDDASVGLVIFSDVAYELLPPVTSASQLRPLLRLLAPPKLGPPVNPWARSFSAGTQISGSLELAREMLVRDGVKNGSILLLSDLITAPEDVPQLARTVSELKRQSITVRVVPLSPLDDGRTIFEGLLGKSAFIPPSQIGDPQRVLTETRGGAVPSRFLLLGGLLLAVLAAHERFVGRLGLPRTRRRHA